MSNYMISEHDCATGITTEREMTDEEMVNIAALQAQGKKQAETENAQAVVANAKLATTREKFLGMGLTQEEVDLIVPADKDLRPGEVAVAE